MHVNNEDANPEYHDALLERISKIRADPNIYNVMKSSEVEPSTSTNEYDPFEFDDNQDDDPEHHEESSLIVSRNTISNKKDERVSYDCYYYFIDLICFSYLKKMKTLVCP